MCSETFSWNVSLRASNPQFHLKREGVDASRPVTRVNFALVIKRSRQTLIDLAASTGGNPVPGPAIVFREVENRAHVAARDLRAYMTHPVPGTGGPR